MKRKTGTILLFLSFFAIWSTPLWAIDSPIEVRFYIGHAYCSGTNSYSFSINGTPVGAASYASSNGCYCNVTPQIIILNDAATLAAVGSIGCTLVSFTTTDYSYLGYVRAEIDRTESGTEKICLIDYAGGTCEDRDLCNGYSGASGSYTNNLADTDNDGILDCDDPDIDGDGVLNANDNCPLNYNPGQEDNDGNGVGNVCDSDPKPICVPWQGDINKYHTAMSGQEVILKGVIRNNVLAGVWYKWNFGDGTESSVFSVSGKKEYKVEMAHTYTGAVGSPFTAELIVADNDALAKSIKDKYLVKIEETNLDSKINLAIDNGLWFLYKNGGNDNPNYKSFDNSPVMVWAYESYFTSPTASAVQAFEINGHKETGNPDEDPYVTAVSNGLNWLFNGYYSSGSNPMLQAASISLQHGENPDTNGNGIGIEARDYGYNPTYQGGMIMDAIISSGTPDADSGRDFDGDGTTDTYREIIQDMCDMYAFGQEDWTSGGNIIGGWRYSWNYGSADNSISQWAAIGMIPAQEPPWNCTVPAWVKTYNNNWLNYSYGASVYGNPLWGGYGYTDTSPIWGYYAVTPSGMVQLSFSGNTTADSRWVTCERYLADNWKDTGDDWLDSENVYAYYALAKAMRLAKPQPVVNFASNNFDWYRGNGAVMGLAEKIADHLIANNGSFDYYGPALGSAWSVIILRPVLFQAAPIACFDADPNPSYADTPISFDPGCSSHSEPGKDINNLTLFEWDWNNDGVYDASSATPEETTHAFSCATLPCTYPVKLRVTDDAGLHATYVMNITISNPPHPPVAQLTGPYMVSLCEGDTLKLDGSNSYDPNEGDHEAGCGACPDDTITAWKWDLDGAPYTYTNESGKFIDFGTGFTGYFGTPGDYNIGLKVFDNTKAAYPNSGKENLTDEAFTTVKVYADGGLCDLTAVKACSRLTLSWNNIGAAKYVVFRSHTGPNLGYWPVKEVTGNSASMGSILMDFTTYHRVMAIMPDGTEYLSKALATYMEPELCLPSANPGGPYSGCVNQLIPIDGTGSSAQIGVIVQWEWDMDNDGAYDDAFSQKFDWKWLAPGTYTIGLRVKSSDSLVLYNQAQTTVTIEACGPSCTDVDSDGFSPDGGECGLIDCNDGDRTVYPGAEERCDKKDNDCDGETDEGLTCEPTFAEEIILSATPGDNTAVLTWKAVSESDVLGYNILRKDGLLDAYEQINDNLIFAKGSPETTVSYEFIDNDVQNGRFYAYKLVEVEKDGNTKEHGPVFIMPSLLYGLMNAVFGI